MPSSRQKEDLKAPMPNDANSVIVKQVLVGQAERKLRHASPSGRPPGFRCIRRCSSQFEAWGSAGLREAVGVEER